MTGGRLTRVPATSRSGEHLLPAAGRGLRRRGRRQRTVDSSQTLVHSGTAPSREQPHDEPAVREPLLLGRYRLLEQLGAGGFGVVWRARDELLCRDVAVKRIPIAHVAQQGSDDRSAGEPAAGHRRAAREARATARLSHPAIVSLYEACADAAAFYLISELVEGDTLAALIARRALADEQVLRIGIALADALSHAHSRGVIHRDVKPQNVLVPRACSAPKAFAAAKLTDFGGAYIGGQDVLTRNGDVLGTLAYMAPEQSEGREATEAADLYSLALVLYEALCGVNPARGSTPAQTARLLSCAIPPLGPRRQDLPAGLASAIDRALTRREFARGTIDDLRAALEEALAPVSPAASAASNQSSAPAWIAPRGQAPAFPVEAPTRRRPGAPAAPLEAPAWQGVRNSGPSTDAALRLRARHARRQALDVRPPEQAGRSAQADVGERARRSPPRAVWAAAAGALIAWQAWGGRPGVALLLLAALVPLLLLPLSLRPPSLLCGLAPVLGLAGLAGAFPALAGQAARWRARAAMGALGYWWLTLAEPLVGRRLWLGTPSSAPARSVWEGSLGSAATHVVGPTLSVGVLLGAALWACGAVILPWLVRGARAAIDVVAATVWSAALISAAPVIDSGLATQAAAPSPRGAVLGAVFGAGLAVGARPLRGHP